VPWLTEFEYISHARLEYRDRYRHAYLGEVTEPVVYGVQERSVSITAPRKDRQWPRRSTTSWPRSRAECTARCVAPWQGARSRLIAIPSRPLSTVASRASATRSASSRFTPLRSCRASGGARGNRACPPASSPRLPRASEREGRDRQSPGMPPFGSVTRPSRFEELVSREPRRCPTRQKPRRGHARDTITP